MNTFEAEAALIAKKHLLADLLKQRAFGPQYRALEEEVLRLERVVAEARGEPFVTEALPDQWPGMAHFTAVLGDAFHCTVLFATMSGEHMALRFVSVRGYMVTTVSDEIIEGHPLTGRGLTSYRAFVVNNSAWLKELESIDSVHPQHNASTWRTNRHYLLAFKDRIFEAIAQGVEFMGTYSNFEEALQWASAQVRPAVR